jgi:hypothetical protein
MLVFVGILACYTPAFSVTGTGQITVATGAESITTLAANTAFVLVGWVPVVTSVISPVGNIYAYVNGQGFPFAALTGASQEVNTVVGQFTVNALSGALELVPAFQANADFVLTNNSASTRTVILGCVANQVGGACLFNVRTVPTADPIF